MAEHSSERRTLADNGPERGAAGAMPPLVVAAIIITGLYFARQVLQPLALAVLLSLLLGPVVRWLRQYGMPRVPAVFLTVLLAFVLIVGFLVAVGDQAVSLVQNLPGYQENIAAKIRSLSGDLPGAGMLARAGQVFRDLGAEFAASAGPGAAALPAGESRLPVPVVIRETEPALQVLRNIVGPMLSPLFASGLVLVFVVMFLLKREDLRDRLLRLAGARDLHRVTAAMNEAAERVSNYLLTQLAVGICYGVPIGIGLTLIGIPNAPLWGMLGVVLRFIPYLGGALTALFPVALAIAVDPGWGLLVWTVLLFVVVEVTIGNVVEPLAYGRSTGLSPVAVLGAALFWTWLWGVIGLLLATPLTVCLVVLGRYIPNLQFLDILLGNQPVLSPEESLYQRLLAQNPEEATEQTEEFAREKSIAAFFDEVAVPALILAQADSDRGVLAPHRRAIIAEGFAAILDNLSEDGLVDPRPAGERPAGEHSGATIACIAGRNELDLAAAWLLQHLLQQRGHRAAVFSPDAVSTFNIDRLPLRGVAVVCLSLLSTSSTARARYLVRRIRRRARRARIVIGFWGQGGAESSLAEATAATASDSVVTSVSAAVAEIEAALAESNPETPRESGALTALRAITGPS
jgi:predicted PurR-regulated permease PerM